MEYMIAFGWPVLRSISGIGETEEVGSGLLLAGTKHRMLGQGCQAIEGV